jgi:hypothetical protein
MNRRKRANLNKRTALSPRNILEYEASECARVKQQNRSMRSKVLKTNPTLLQVVYVANPTKVHGG